MRRWVTARARWVVLLAWMGLIFYLSGQSTLPHLIDFPEVQAIAGHFLVFGVLALLWRWNLAAAGVPHATLWALALTVLYGLSDEFHQRYVPGRHPDLFDVLTDSAGAAAALQFDRLRRKRSRPIVEPTRYLTDP